MYTSAWFVLCLLFPFLFRPVRPDCYTTCFDSTQIISNIFVYFFICYSFLPCLSPHTHTHTRADKQRTHSAFTTSQLRFCLVSFHFSAWSFVVFMLRVVWVRDRGGHLSLSLSVSVCVLVCTRACACVGVNVNELVQCQLCGEAVYAAWAATSSWGSSSSTANNSNNNPEHNCERESCTLSDWHTRRSALSRALPLSTSAGAAIVCAKLITHLHTNVCMYIRVPVCACVYIRS